MPEPMTYGTAAYQGTKLTGIAGLPEDMAQKLVSLGITHAGQFIGTASVGATQNLMAEFLAISPEELTRTVNKVKKSLPSGVADLYSGEAFALPALGALPPTEAMKAEAAALPAAAAALGPLPPFVNLSSDFPPIRNQAARGTCTAFAMTALNEYAQIKGGNPQDLSEEYLYKAQKDLDRRLDLEGSWLKFASQALAQFGQCRESVWPYNPGFSPADTNKFGPKPAGADADAANFRLQTLALPPNDVNGIKATLAGGSPVPVSFPVFHSWFSAPDTIQTGRITMPLPGEQPFAGHAVCFVGYQDDPTAPGGGFFILRNQWKKVGLELGGTVTAVDWAELSQYGVGYGTMPYQYMANLGSEAYGMQNAPAPAPPPNRDNLPDSNDVLRKVFDFFNLGGGTAQIAGLDPAQPGTTGESPGQTQRIVVVTKDGTRIIIS